MVSVPNVDSFSIAVNIGRLANLSNACGMGAYGRQPWTGGDSGPRWSSPRNFRDVAEKRRDCFFGCCQVGGKGALEDDGWEGGIRRYILALALVSLDFDYPSKGFGKLRSSRGVYLTLPLLFIFTTCLYRQHIHHSLSTCSVYMGRAAYTLGEPFPKPLLLSISGWRSDLSLRYWQADPWVLFGSLPLTLEICGKRGLLTGCFW